MHGRGSASLAIAVVVLAGCAKDPAPDVYVAGYDSNDTVYLAMLWKNGHPTALSDGVLGAKAFGVAVSGTSVYVAGVASDGTIAVPVIWKDGVPATLQHGTGSGVAEAVAVADGTVYAAGTVNGSPVLWKDGAVTPLSEYGDRGGGEALGLALDAGDVYVAGWEYAAYPVEGGYDVRLQARYWVNGEAHPLTGAGVDGEAKAVVVSGGDVYVAGWKGPDHFPAQQVAVVWKNGVELPLTDGLFAAGANALAVRGEDVVAAGGEDFDGAGVAKLWWNGAAIDLPATGGAQASGIAVDGDVHVVGAADGEAGGVAMYWKNGAPHALTDGGHDAWANAIVVVGR